MPFSPLLKQLIDAFRVLPGVGPKSAQRMVYYLLDHDREGAGQLANLLTTALKQVGHCEHCRTLCEKPKCRICGDLQRDHSLLCVVAGPLHVAAIEQTGGYLGLYFVLSGHLSPIDGMGPQEIGIDAFVHRLSLGTVKEVVLATNATVEGEATAYYLAEIVKAHGLKVTRIAQGVPMGGELDYIDGGTIARALVDRTII